MLHHFNETILIQYNVGSVDYDMSDLALSEKPSAPGKLSPAAKLKVYANLAYNCSKRFRQLGRLA